MSDLPVGWRVDVDAVRVVFTVPPRGPHAEYMLTPDQGRTVAGNILRSLALSYEGRDVEPEQDIPIRWVVAIAATGVRLRPLYPAPSGVYLLEDSEALGLAMALSRACEIAGRLEADEVDDEGSILMDDTVRGLPGYMSLLELGAARQEPETGGSDEH